MEKSPTLKRDLGFLLLVFYGLGNILGAGIYVLVGKVAGIAGYYAPFAFVISAFVAYFTALSYAELSARFPYSAGEALYVQKGFNNKNLTIAAGLIVCMSAIVSAATISHGFIGYLQVYIDIPDTIGIILITLLLGVIASRGITQAVGVAAALTVLEIIGLLIIVVSGTEVFSQTANFTHELNQNFSPGIVLTVFAGAFVAFYAFLGFEDMVNVAEEVKNPTTLMPKAILFALLVATIFYFLIAMIAVMAVEPTKLAESKAPLALVYTTLTNNDPAVITLISLFAVINGALIQIIMVSRLLYGMSKNEWIPSFFSDINKTTNTPVKATLFSTAAVLTAALLFPILTLAKFTSLFVLILFIVVNAALLKIKQQTPHVAGVKSYSKWIPIIGIITSSSLVLMEIIS